MLHRQRATKDRGEAYDNPMTFRLNGRWGRGAFTSLLEVAPEVGKNQSRIEKEFLKLPSGRIYRRDHTGRCESFNDKATLERARKVAKTESAAPQDWANQLRRWQFLRLSPDQMGQPTRTRNLGELPMLERDGSNIGQYLHSLREASVDVYEGLLEALRFVVPYARDLQTSVTDSIERRAYLEIIAAEAVGSRPACFLTASRQASCRQSKFRRSASGQSPRTPSTSADHREAPSPTNSQSEACRRSHSQSLAGSRCEADRRRGPVAIRSQPSTTDRPTNPKQTPAVPLYLTSSTSVSC